MKLLDSREGLHGFVSHKDIFPETRKTPFLVLYIVLSICIILC